MRRLVLITVLMFILISLFSCQNRQLDGLWVSENYDFFFFNEDSLYYYNKDYCIYYSLFLKVKNNNFLYTTERFPYPCSTPNHRPDLAFRSMNIQVLKKSDDFIYVVNNEDSCFLSYFRSDSILLKKLHYSNMKFNWDSLTVKLTTTGNANLYETTLIRDKMSYLTPTKIEPKKERILTLENEIWLIAQEEHKWFQKPYIQDAIHREYMLYFNGNKIAKKRLPSGVCYFSAIDKIVFSRYRESDDYNEYW